MTDRRLGPLLRGTATCVGLGLLLSATALLSRGGSVTDPVLRTGRPQYVVPAAAHVPVAARGERASGAGVRRAPVADLAWVAGTASATGVPARAVEAYADAALRAAADLRACRLGWTTLAGLGHVESGHGSISGHTLAADGRPVPPILGIALDGSGGTAAIPADDRSARWHGDPRWDHAVGPLQFIPSTWERWGSDGDGDGIADPNDLDDAAWTAARYLCAAGRDLTTGSGWADAVFSYNHSDSYVAAVSAAATAYGERAG